MFGSLLDTRIEISCQWLPDWAYTESEKDKIKNTAARYDNNVYVVLVNVKESGLFLLR